MATQRYGPPYIWTTHLAKALGGATCLWRFWFAARFRYDKVEEQAFDLAQWNRDHTELMRKRRRELEREGWTVAVEEQNAFKLQTKSGALLAGKPDIVATKPGIALVVDGKTGKGRDSDIWQVLIYLFALPRCRPDITGDLEGEVQYKRGDERLTLTPSELTPNRIEHMAAVVRTISGDAPPPKAPSRQECKYCNVGSADCPQRVRELEAVTVEDF